MYKHIDIANMLVTAGVNPFQRDCRGLTVLHVLGSLHESQAWLQRPYGGCMRVLDDQSRSPLFRCPACCRQVDAMRIQDRKTSSTTRGGNVQSDAVPRSALCCCSGQLLDAALAQDRRVHMLLVPELLRCVGRPGGILGYVVCSDQAALEPGNHSLMNGWDAVDMGVATIADIPLDVRIQICRVAGVVMDSSW